MSQEPSALTTRPLGPALYLFHLVGRNVVRDKKITSLTPYWKRTRELVIGKQKLDHCATTKPCNFLIRSELKRRSGNDPTPGGGDVRRLMAELCILPLSMSSNRSRDFEVVWRLFSRCAVVTSLTQSMAMTYLQHKI